MPWVFEFEIAFFNNGRIYNTNLVNKKTNYILSFENQILKLQVLFYIVLDKKLQKHKKLTDQKRPKTSNILRL